ncbi:MAG TPA: rhomboid family intramembrane serine protease [Cyclobacteriaceae bacterium]|nr:rhomboid family intramembrane serine protease [Cyclobacteriaceae bacterium]
MFRLTPVVRNLIIINVIVFIFQTISDDVLTQYLALYNQESGYFKPYQLFTYMFAHGSFSHIFFNMLSLAFMGPILESFWGQKKFLLFYLITGIGAGLFNFMVEMFIGSGPGVMVGASGAIYGLLMAFGMIFPNMEVMLLIPPIPIKAKYLVFLLGGLTFLMDRSGQVAHFAHLGGVVVGFIVIKAWRSQGGNYY